MKNSQTTISLIKQLVLAAGLGKLDQVKILAGQVDPRQDNSSSLSAAAAAGHYETVVFLQPLSNDQAYNAIKAAAHGGWLDCVKALADDAPTDTLDQSLILACSNGHTRTVDYLLGLKVSESAKAECLLTAIHKGNHTLVATALNHMDGRGRESEAICWAIEDNQKSIVDMLWSVSDLHAQTERPLVEAAKIAAEHWVEALMPEANLEELGIHLRSRQDWSGINALAAYLPGDIVFQWREQLTSDEQSMVPVLMSRWRERELQSVPTRNTVNRVNRPRA